MHDLLLKKIFGAYIPLEGVLEMACNLTGLRVVIYFFLLGWQLSTFHFYFWIQFFVHRFCIQVSRAWLLQWYCDFIGFSVGFGEECTAFIWNTFGHFCDGDRQSFSSPTTLVKRWCKCVRPIKGSTLILLHVAMENYAFLIWQLATEFQLWPSPQGPEKEK